jgi:hypothetical protein
MAALLFEATMGTIKQLSTLLSGLIVLALPAFALGQSMSGFSGGGSGFSSGSTSSSSGFGFGGSSGSSSSGFGFGGSSGSSSSGFGFGGSSGTSGTSFLGTTSSGTGARGGGSSSPVNQSNILSTYYGNMFSTGNINSSTNSRTMGSFGQPLYKISTPNATVTNQTFGSATVGGGRGGVSSSSANNYNFNAGAVVADTTRRPAVAATLGFRPAVRTPAQLQVQLRDALDRSSSIPSKQKISIEMVDNNVILRGQVADDDERRHVESLIRLTPGIGEVRNELVPLSP